MKRSGPGIEPIPLPTRYADALRVMQTYATDAGNDLLTFLMQSFVKDTK